VDRSRQRRPRAWSGSADPTVYEAGGCVERSLRKLLTKDQMDRVDVRNVDQLAEAIVREHEGAMPGILDDHAELAVWSAAADSSWINSVITAIAFPIGGPPISLAELTTRDWLDATAERTLRVFV
jgi:hypothetical protein